MSSLEKQLEALAERIERLSLDPDGIHAQGWFRLTSALFALTGWRATVRYDALRALGTGELGKDRRGGALADAVTELEANVSTVERVAILRRKPPVAHAAWLRRVLETLSLAATVERSEQPRPGEAADQMLRRADPVGLLPPLSLADEGGEASLEEVRTSILETRRDGARMPADDHRLVELELAAIDHLFVAARTEHQFLGRRRRLLVAARQRLLEAAQAIPLDRTGTKIRADYAAREIARIDRFEGAGVAMDVALVHQAKGALARGEIGPLHATLAAIDDGAARVGDVAVAEAAHAALGVMWGGEEREGDAARRASRKRSAADLFGREFVDEVGRAIAGARTEVAAKLAACEGGKAKLSLAQDLEFLTETAEAETLEAAIVVDGCFEVGGALVPRRVYEETRVLRRVRYPTQQLELFAAEDASDIPDAIVSDPRTVLLDLATGRLLARRFVRQEPARRPRVVLQSEVRVFVLDGSGSMLGPRARVRDAILLAELATLSARMSVPGEARCTLLYSYFTDVLGPIERVDDVASARAAVRDVVATARRGGTDIQKALLASLEQVAVARELDPELTRAQIVLVTDGESPMNEEALAVAHAAACGADTPGAVPIGISVIALGKDNDVLRGIVARQRTRGVRAFYHHIDDDQAFRLTRGQLDGGTAVHPPSLEGLADLEATVGPLLEEIEGLDRARDREALARIDAEAHERRAAAAEDIPGSGDGARARAEAIHRDHVALDARFGRWFPPQVEGAERGRRPAAGTVERDDLDATRCVLASVAEVVVVLGGTELVRQADAIDLVERLLPDAGLSPGRYRAVLRDFPFEVAAELCAVRDAVRPLGPDVR